MPEESLEESVSYLISSLRSEIQNHNIICGTTDGLATLINKIKAIPVSLDDSYLLQPESYVQQTTTRYDNEFSTTNPTLRIDSDQENNIYSIAIPSRSQVCHANEFTSSNNYILTFKFKISSLGYNAGFVIGEPSSFISSTVQTSVVTFTNMLNGNRTDSSVSKISNYPDYVNVKIIRNGLNWTINWNDGEIIKELVSDASNKLGFLVWSAQTVSVYDMKLRLRNETPAEIILNANNYIGIPVKSCSTSNYVLTNTAVGQSSMNKEFTDSTNYTLEFDYYTNQDNRNGFFYGINPDMQNGTDTHNGTTGINILVDIDKTYVEKPNAGSMDHMTLVYTHTSNLFTVGTHKIKIIRNNNNADIYIDNTLLYSYNDVQYNTLGLNKWQNGYNTISNISLT